MNKEMTKKLTVGLLKGPVEFWCNGTRVQPDEAGRVQCTSVRLPRVFISEETNKEGTPVSTGYAATRFVDATQFANAISKLKNNNKGVDVEIPVVMEGYTSVKTGDHSYKLWSFAVEDGTPLIAWDELKLVPKRTSEGLSKKILARFTNKTSEGKKGFPTVVPVAWAPRNANAQVAEVSDR